MRTVFDVKRALDYDTMIDVVRQVQDEKERLRKAAIQKHQAAAKRRNLWNEVFPACKQ